MTRKTPLLWNHISTLTHLKKTYCWLILNVFEGDTVLKYQIVVKGLSINDAMVLFCVKVMGEGSWKITNPHDLWTIIRFFLTFQFVQRNGLELSLTQVLFKLNFLLVVGKYCCFDSLTLLTLNLLIKASCSPGESERQLNPFLATSKQTSSLFPLHLESSSSKT